MLFCHEMRCQKIRVGSEERAGGAPCGWVGGGGLSKYSALSWGKRDLGAGGDFQSCVRGAHGGRRFILLE